MGDRERNWIKTLLTQPYPEQAGQIMGRPDEGPDYPRFLQRYTDVELTRLDALNGLRDGTVVER